MSCPSCGSPTPRAGKCKTCSQIDRLEDEHGSDRGRSDRYRCPSCGQMESTGDGRECWVCRSDRVTRDDDGHVVEVGT